MRVLLGGQSGMSPFGLLAVLVIGTLIYVADPSGINHLVQYLLHSVFHTLHKSFTHTTTTSTTVHP